MTNLLAVIVSTVSLVTNVTTRVSQHYESLPCPEGRIGCAVAHGQFVDDPMPSVKWYKTTVKRVTKATFEWNGKAREVADEEILAEVEVECRKQDSWLPVATNDPPKLSMWGTLNDINVTNIVGTNLSFYFTNSKEAVIYYGSLTVTNKP